MHSFLFYSSTLSCCGLWEFHPTSYHTPPECSEEDKTKTFCWPHRGKSCPRSGDGTEKIGTRNGRTQHPPSVDVTWIEFRNGFPWAMTVQIGVRVFSFFVTYFLRCHTPMLSELLDKEEAKLFSVYSLVAYPSNDQNRRNRCPNHWWHVRDQLLWFRECDFELNQRVLVRCSSARTWLGLSYHGRFPKLRAEPTHLYKHFWRD